MKRYEGAYCVIGPPGTGKTTFLSAQVRECVEAGETPLICSLTNAATREIAGRDLGIPKEQVGTLHAHAFRLAGCSKQLAENNLDDWNQAHPSMRLSSNVLDRDNPDAAQQADGDGTFRLYDVLRHRLVPQEDFPEHVAYFASEWESWKAEHDLLDFTDMITGALADIRTPACRPTIIIADEAQDHSRLEYALLKKWAQAAGAMVFCGDPWQSLYVWRGADPGLFRDPEIPASHRKVLGQSYRVPRAVHALATQWVRQLSDWAPIEYRPRDAAGTVKRLPLALTDHEGLITRAFEHLAAGESVMFAASCGYMLNGLLATLRGAGVPFANPWAEHRPQWSPLTASRGWSMAQRLGALLRPFEAVYGDVFDHAVDARRGCRPWKWAELAAWAAPLAADVFNHGAKADIERSAKECPDYTITDNELQAWFTVEQLPLVRAWLTGDQDPQLAVNWWDANLRDSQRQLARYPLAVARRSGPQHLTERPRLYVGTIHSFKGGEADAVYVFPDVSPQGFRSWHGSPGYRDAVVRQFYVAFTRAREQLFLCAPMSSMSVEFAA